MSVDEAIRIMINADEEIQVLRRQLKQAILEKEILTARLAESERDFAAIKCELEEIVRRYREQQEAMATVAASSAVARSESPQDSRIMGRIRVWTPQTGK